MGERDGGFSLVEVVIAMALLAGVLIAISGLFVIGGRHVKSGRTSSEALAVGKEIQEDLVGWSYAQLWETFGYDGRATRYAVDTRSCSVCAPWQSTLAAKLGPSAYADIEIESVDDATGSVTDFADASGETLVKTVRVSVTVNWAEVPDRPRSVTLGTTRN
jgi:type II secretory pathway pseudopilin PulG